MRAVAERGMAATTFAGGLAQEVDPVIVVNAGGHYGSNGLQAVARPRRPSRSAYLKDEKRDCLRVAFHAAEGGASLAIRTTWPRPRE